MLSATTLRDMWEGIVTSHESGLSFHSVWNVVLDEDHDIDYPACIYREPEQSGVTQGKAILDAFTVSMEFRKEHATERTTDERDTAHSDMSTVARECFYRFLDLYTRTMTTFNGEDIDLRLEGSYTITPFWDRAGTSTTGVVLTFTVIDNTAPCVGDDTFPLT